MNLGDLEHLGPVDLLLVALCIRRTFETTYTSAPCEWVLHF